MKKPITLGSGFLVLASLLAAETGERHVETPGGFSYCARRFSSCPERVMKKILVTCPALADGGAKLDETFAASLKTFALEK